MQKNVHNNMNNIFRLFALTFILQSFSIDCLLASPEHEFLKPINYKSKDVNALSHLKYNHYGGGNR